MRLPVCVRCGQGMFPPRLACFSCHGTEFIVTEVDRVEVIDCTVTPRGKAVATVAAKGVELIARVHPDTTIGSDLPVSTEPLPASIPAGIAYVPSP